MLAVLVALGLVVGYLEFANRHGDEKVAEFWGGKSEQVAPREQARRVDDPGAAQSVTRFGYKFGSDQ